MRLVQRLRLAVHAHHLLPAGVRHAGQDARLGGGGMGLQALDAADGNLLFAEALQQQAAGFVVAHHAHRQDVDPQRGQVHDGVGAAAGHHGALAMLQDQHRGLARDAGDLAEDKLVGHQVGQHCDRDVAETTAQSSRRRSMSLGGFVHALKESPEHDCEHRAPGNLRLSHGAANFRFAIACNSSCHGSLGVLQFHGHRRHMQRLEPLDAGPRLMASFSVVTNAVAPHFAGAAPVAARRRHRCKHDDRENSACRRRRLRRP